MPWTLLFLAGLFEVAWAVGLKYTDGFTKLMPTTLTVAAMVASIVLLRESMIARMDDQLRELAHRVDDRPGRHLDEQPVSGAVPQGVVDRAESVQVQQQQREPALGPARTTTGQPPRRGTRK